MNSLCGFGRAEAVTNSFHFGNNITCSGEGVVIRGNGSVCNGIRTEPLISNILIAVSNTNLKCNFTIYTNRRIGNCNFRNRVGVNINRKRFAFDTTTIITRYECSIGISAFCKIFCLCIDIASQRGGCSCNTIFVPSDLRIDTRIVVRNSSFQFNLSGSGVIVASILRSGNNNREGRNDIDCIINCRVTTRTFLCEADTINELVDVGARGFRSITENGLVGLVVRKNFTITSPNIGTVSRCRNISLEFVFKTIADCILGRSLSNSNCRHIDYFNGINTCSRAVGILLTDTDKVLVITHRCRGDRQSTIVLTIEESSIAGDLVPLISNIICSEIANVRSESNITTCADAVLIMGDLSND